MTKEQEEVASAVCEFILREFLQGEDAAFLENTTPLISSGILDSIANARLVAFLEDKYDVRFKPHEVRAETLDTVDQIVATIIRKREAKEQ